MPFKISQIKKLTIPKIQIIKIKMTRITMVTMITFIIEHLLCTRHYFKCFPIFKTQLDHLDTILLILQLSKQKIFRQLLINLPKFTYANNHYAIQPPISKVPATTYK